MCGEDKEKSQGNSFQSIESFVPHKILVGGPDPDYYSGVKQLRVKVRIAHNMRKLGKQFQADMKQLSRQFLVEEEEEEEKKKKREKETGNIFSQRYKTKVNDGQSSSST